MSKQINWGIIGPGKIAHKFAQDLLLVEGAGLYGVASRDLTKAKTFAAQYGAKRYYGSYEELACDPMIDVVYVATPHPFHFPNTMLCLEHGKAVLCEKPFGMNTREVEAMIAEARKRKLFLMEAFWTRFIPGTEKLLELLAADAIGEIVMIKADFGFVGDTDPVKRVYNKTLGAGSLLDIGIYPVYLSLLLMGVPHQIKAMATFTHTGVDSICTMLFDYERGQKAILDSTILANTQVEALIYGKKGTIKMHPSFHHTQRLSITCNNGNIETIDINLTGNGYYHEIAEVTNCLQNNKTESEKMPLSMSLDLIKSLDKVRKEIGLAYQQDDGICALKIRK
jgi:predicted dehydrogenase